MKNKKMNLQIFGIPENETVESWLDMLGDHGDLTADMPNEVVALLVIASRIENMSEALDERMADLSDKLDKIANSVELLEKLSDCVDSVPQYGERFIVGGSVDAGVQKK